MTKKEISYRELLGKVSSIIKKEAAEAGEKFDIKKVGKATSERWKKVKAGNDPEFVQGKSAPVTRKKKSKKSKKDTSEEADEEKHESHKYVHHHHITAQAILDNVDLCSECRDKIKEYMSSSKSNFCKTAKKGKKSKKKRKTRKAKKAKSA